jgi:hypothetical protein
MQLRYVGPFDIVEIGGTDFHPDAGRTCAQGDTIDVADDLAGRAPTWLQGGADEPVYDPGEGLLAQPANWKLATAPYPVVVGEQGPEIVDLPAGAVVTPAAGPEPHDDDPEGQE